MSVDVGDKAPDFDMPTDGGGRIKLSELKGRKIVLYFYPRDDTPGCTTEANGFRDALPDFSKVNASIVGVSKDTVKKHDKFKAKYDLPFTLASDEDGSVCEAYGVWQLKKFMGREAMGIVRSTFLIDEDGVIEAAWRKVRVKDHVAEVLAAAKGG